MASLNPMTRLVLEQFGMMHLRNLLLRMGGFVRIGMPELQQLLNSVFWIATFTFLYTSVSALVRGLLERLPASLRRAEEAAVCWFVVSGGFHLLFHGGYLLLSLIGIAPRQARTAQWVLFGDSGSTPLNYFQAITASILASLCFIVIYFITTQNVLRHPIQIAVCTAQLCSTILHCVVIRISSHHSFMRGGKDVFSDDIRAALICLSAIFPSILLHTSIKTITRTFTALEKVSTTLSNRHRPTTPIKPRIISSKKVASSPLNPVSRILDFSERFGSPESLKTGTDSTSNNSTPLAKKEDDAPVKLSMNSAHHKLVATIRASKDDIDLEGSTDSVQSGPQNLSTGMSSGVDSTHGSQSEPYSIRAAIPNPSSSTANSSAIIALSPSPHFHSKSDPSDPKQTRPSKTTKTPPPTSSPSPPTTISTSSESTPTASSSIVSSSTTSDNDEESDDESIGEIIIDKTFIAGIRNRKRVEEVGLR